jgi:hypothetical protein
MATYASKLRKEALDNTTVRLNSSGQVMAGGIMEPFSAGTKGGAPAVFYVDGNVLSSGDGLSWATAKKTVTEGLALAQAYQSTSGNRAWAHRSTVYCCGDSFTEDLVILAEKTDVIGVGSCNSLKKPELIGNHVPVTTNCWGCRFINWQFSEADAGAMWTLTSVSAGINFIDCDFSVRGAVATHGILMTAMGYGNVIIEGCLFDGFPSGFSTGAIVVGAGLMDKLIIRNNTILGALSIVIGAMTNVAGICLIDNNVIVSAGKVITDASNLAFVTRNRMITTGIAETTPGDMWDGSAPRWCDNIITGSGGTADQVPYVSES